MTGNVVKTLRVKAGDGTFPDASAYPIGTEPRYISAIRNSNNNNLEEQLLLGTDCIKTFWYDGDDEDDLNYHTRIEYRKDIENPTDFYVMEIRDAIQAGETRLMLNTLVPMEESVFETHADYGGRERYIKDLYSAAEFFMRQVQDASKIVNETLPNLNELYGYSEIEDPSIVNGLNGIIEWQDNPEAGSQIQNVKLFFYKTKNDLNPLLVAEKQTFTRGLNKVVELDHYDSGTDTYYFKRVSDHVCMPIYEKIENKL